MFSNEEKNVKFKLLQTIFIYFLISRIGPQPRYPRSAHPHMVGPRSMPPLSSLPRPQAPSRPPMMMPPHPASYRPPQLGETLKSLS